jgi:hypothetical protein
VPVDRLSVALFVVCGLLLMSMGGAVVAAPVTLPLMYLAVRRRPTPGFRWAGGVIAALTAPELAWAIVYVVDGEEAPQIWLLPLAVTVAVLVLFVTIGRQARRSRRSPSRNQTSTPSRSRR